MAVEFCLHICLLFSLVQVIMYGCKPGLRPFTGEIRASIQVRWRS